MIIYILITHYKTPSDEHLYNQTIDSSPCDSFVAFSVGSAILLCYWSLLTRFFSIAFASELPFLLSPELKYSLTVFLTVAGSFILTVWLIVLAVLALVLYDVWERWVHPPPNCSGTTSPQSISVLVFAPFSLLLTDCLIDTD